MAPHDSLKQLPADITMLPSRMREIAPSILLGIIVAMVYVPVQILDPTNIAWLNKGDSATVYLGWNFFREGPWALPLGSNPLYGLEIASSIVYSDSNPLFSLIFKVFKNLLPDTFQFFGIWIYICICLQSLFAWVLVGMVTRSTLLRLLSSAFFLFAPPFWGRFEHLNLMSHFLILASIYLALVNGRRKSLLWLILLSVTIGIHFYIAIIAMTIWASDIWKKSRSGISNHTRILIEISGTITILGLIAWQFGYFASGTSVGENGFGFYRMNVLSPFDSDNWSYILKDIPGGPGDYEGFNYLGLGVIILALFAVPSVVSDWQHFSRIIRSYRPLIAVAGILSCLAISNHIGIGSVDLRISLPGWTLQALQLVRSSGRLFWPVFYLVLLAIIFVILVSYRPREAAILLGIALVAQIVDTSLGWSRIRESMFAQEPASRWTTSLTDDFWNEAGQLYTKVKWIPTVNQSPRWKDISYFASTKRMATNAIYLARVNRAKLEEAQNQDFDTIRSGNYDQDTLYILDDSVVTMAQIELDDKSDMLSQINGLNVLAPGWFERQNCGKSYPPVSSVSRLEVGDSVSFAEKGPEAAGLDGRKYLVVGWSGQEADFTWSEGNQADITIPLASGPVTAVKLKLGALVAPQHPFQRVSVSINDVASLTTVLKEPSATTLQIPIPKEALRSLGTKRILNLHLTLPDAVRPVDVGLNGDTRELAVSLYSLSLK